MMVPSYLQGLNCEENGKFNWPKVNALFDAAYNEHPEDELIIDRLRVIYLMLQDRHHDCIDLGLKVLSNTNDDDVYADICISVARSYDGLYQKEKAIEFYNTSIEKSSECNSQALLELAELYQKQQNYNMVIETYKRGLDDEDERYGCLYKIGEAYTNMKDYDNAEHYLNLAIEHTPSDEPAYSNMGKLFADKKDYMQAIHFFNKQMEVAEDKSVAYYCIGLCWQEQGDYYRAMHNYTEALKIDPKFPEVYNNIGKLMMEHEGNVKEGIAYLEKAIEECNEESSKVLYYMNLYRIYKNVVIDYDKAAYYKKCYLECLGFPVDLEYESDDEGDDDELPGMDDDDDDIPL